MAAKPPFKLGEHEHVVTAWAEGASGPGWSNRPLWVIIQDGNNDLRRECIQPEDQSEHIHFLYGLSDILNSQLTAEVERLLKAGKKRKKVGHNAR